MPSAAAVNPSTVFKSRRVSPAGACPNVSDSASWVFMDTLLPNKKRKKVEKVMMPSPPIWMSARMTIWPNGLKWVPVSTTVNPVTQVALVAVNSASTKDNDFPTEAGGSISNNAPIRIAPAKLSIRISAAVNPQRRGLAGAWGKASV